MVSVGFDEANVRRDGSGKFAEQGRSAPSELAGADDVSFVAGGTLFKPLMDVEDDFYSMALRFDHDVTDTEMERAAQLLGYAWAKHVHGESLGVPVRIDERTFEVAADSTKGRGIAGEEFLADVDDYLENGTPVRTTDRAGAGTRGTRLVNGLGAGGVTVFAAAGYPDEPDSTMPPLTAAAAARNRVQRIQNELFEAHVVLAEAAVSDAAKNIRAKDPAATHIWLSSTSDGVGPLWAADKNDDPITLASETYAQMRKDLDGVPFIAFSTGRTDRAVQRGTELLFKYRLPDAAASNGKAI